METPSSTRRVTRSQTLSAIKSSVKDHLLSSSKKPEDSDKCQSKSRQRNDSKPNQDRSALFDITNDSPIVGVAMQTPSSGVVVKRNISRIKNTPGSGEALLRGQVKTLLQKVEEGADLTKISMRLLAPTPTNTPQVLDFSDGLQIVITSPVVAAGSSQVREECLSPSINRSLLQDFSDKSEMWNTRNTEEEKVYSYTEEDDEYYEEEEEEEVDGLCEGLKKMSVEGKHTRFVYNSEDEEIVEILVEDKEESPRVLHLKGVPTPGGKHDRFSDDDE